eukprot:jgi/Galph1/1496/GphlegSOOS_G180.1
MSVVLFREDTSLEDNLISLLRDLYDFQEPYKDSIPGYTLWLVLCLPGNVFLLKQNVIIGTPGAIFRDVVYFIGKIVFAISNNIFRLHHMVNYQLISSAVFRFHRGS